MCESGRWHVNDVKPNANGESQEVKVKVRIDQNGLLLIASSSLIEQKEPEVENGETEQNDASGSGEKMDTHEVSQQSCSILKLLFLAQLRINVIHRSDRISSFSFLIPQSSHQTFK